MHSANNNNDNRKRASTKNVLVGTLLGAGWKKTQKGLLFDKPELEYSNGATHLQVEYGDTKNTLYFTIADRSGKQLCLVIRFQKKLEDVLRAITNFQDTITPSNFREHVRTLVGMSVPVFVDTGDELVPVVDEDE